MFDFINDFFNGLVELFFIVYVIIIICMGLFASPVYVISEIIMLIIGILVYKSNNSGPNNFKVCWGTATMWGFIGFLFGPIIGALLAVIIRILIFKNMIK